MESKAMVGPVGLLAIANELLAVPPAQPLTVQATANRAAAMMAGGTRLQTRNKIAERPLILPSDIVKIH